MFPLAAILPPASLTVDPLTTTQEDHCHGVRTLNFEQEKTKNWRILERINGSRSISVSLWNCTLKDSDTLANVPFNETFFDYWTGTSHMLDQISTQSALTGAVIPRRNASLEICGVGWNCSYTISFKAPGYKCAELARGQTLDEGALQRQGAPIPASKLLPAGNMSYIAKTDGGDYFRNQLDVEVGGVPKMAPPYPEHLGAFRTEPVLLIGHSVLTTGANPPENRTIPGWERMFEAVVFRCEHYLTNYTVQFNYTFSVQTTTVLHREYLHPLIDTTFIPDKNATDGTKDNTTAIPESNYVLPLDYQHYRLTAAYHSVGKSIRSFLDGHIQYFPFANAETEATKTGLIDTETYLPVSNLMDKIQHFYENMLLSLLSKPQLIIVSWAADTSLRSGPGNSTNSTLLYRCTKTRVYNAYTYNRRDLFIPYAVAIGGALFAVVLGSAALSQNDFHVRDGHVSNVIAATRAPCLESLPWKGNKWGLVPDEVLGIKLGYGVIAEPAASTGVCMGMDLDSPRAASGKVYHGFAPGEVLERTRVATFGPGKGRRRTSAFSFRSWEQSD